MRAGQAFLQAGYRFFTFVLVIVAIVNSHPISKVVVQGIY